MARFVAPLLLFLLVACGDALRVPEDVPITHLPANEDFVLTLVMKSCSDACATYDEPVCSVSVDKAENIIDVDASVGFESNSVEGCAAVCGREILAHCEVDALPAGTYTVKSGSFEAEIVLE